MIIKLSLQRAVGSQPTALVRDYTYVMHNMIRCA